MVIFHRYVNVYQRVIWLRYQPLKGVLDIVGKSIHLEQNTLRYKTTPSATTISHVCHTASNDVSTAGGAVDLVAFKYMREATKQLC